MECGNAGLLDERAWERPCLPGGAWEEGDLGREPGRGQRTLSQWITAHRRSQPGQCRGQQQGALSQGEDRREVSPKLHPGLSSSFPTFPPGLGQLGVGRGNSLGRSTCPGGQNTRSSSHPLQPLLDVDKLLCFPKPSSCINKEKINKRAPALQPHCGSAQTFSHRTIGGRAISPEFSI